MSTRVYPYCVALVFTRIDNERKQHTLLKTGLVYAVSDDEAMGQACSKYYSIFEHWGLVCYNVVQFEELGGTDPAEMMDDPNALP